MFWSLRNQLPDPILSFLDAFDYETQPILVG